MVNGANGELKIPLNRRQFFVVTGGPFRNCPPQMSGVKMAAEVQAVCAVDIPVRDFSVPDPKVFSRGLTKAVDLLLAGDPLYVGCMGGIGRTGLFLAVLAKAFRVKQPVKYVRKHYLSHAVETPQQQEFVKQFKVPPRVYIAIKRARRWSFLRFWKTNLTRPTKKGWVDPEKPSAKEAWVVNENL